MNQPDINIVLAADNNYVQHLAVTLVSILENSSDADSLIFHILDNDISQDSLEKLKTIEKNYGAKLIFYKITKEALNNYPEVNHILKASYSRLLIPDLLPKEIEKIIYLDTDIVVLKDIALLYNQDLKDFSLGAAKDVMSEEISRIYFYPGLTKHFNAGVLLINLKKWREKNIKQESLEIIKQYSAHLVRADQDILNCLFNNDWLMLDDCFNVDLKRQGFMAQADKTTVILHYSDRIKPWSYAFVGPSKKYYFQYLAKTPWADFKFKDKTLKVFIKKYSRVVVREIKRLLLPLLPKTWLDNYRKRLWQSYKVK